MDLRNSKLVICENVYGVIRKTRTEILRNGAGSVLWGWADFDNKCIIYYQERRFAGPAFHRLHSRIL